MVAQREPQRITINEWRQLERANPDVKYEYIDGQIYLMSGGSLAHSRIGSNTVRAFEDALGESSSTEGIDRIRKANLYHACPSIQEYMLIATRYQAVEVQRRAGNEWTLHVFGSNDEIELLSIGVRFPVATLYRGTVVPEAPNNHGR